MMSYMIASMNYKKTVLKNNQYSRRENIEIANIDEDINQHELEKYVLRVLHNLGLTKLSSYDIVAVHRIGKRRPNTNRVTIVRFINRKDAIFSLKNKNKLRNSAAFKTLYNNENLCPENRLIFNQLYKLKNDH